MLFKVESTGSQCFDFNVKLCFKTNLSVRFQKK